MKKKQTLKKKRASSRDPYAPIDWEKVATLFKLPPADLRKNRLVPLAKDVLRIIAGAGAIGLTFAFPGAAPAIGAIFLGDKSYPRWSTNKIFSQLDKQKFVKVTENADGSTTVKITQKGMIRALTYQLGTLQLKKPKHWDGKWRVVIFDVPEKHKRLRDIFRRRLLQLGLYRLQESVYASPYPCFKEIEFLRELYSVSFNVRYLLVDKIEEDSALRDHFELDS